MHSTTAHLLHMLGRLCFWQAVSTYVPSSRRLQLTKTKFCSYCVPCIHRNDYRCAINLPACCQGITCFNADQRACSWSDCTMVKVDNDSNAAPSSLSSFERQTHGHAGLAQTTISRHKAPVGWRWRQAVQKVKVGAMETVLLARPHALPVHMLPVDQEKGGGQANILFADDIVEVYDLVRVALTFCRFSSLSNHGNVPAFT